MCGGFNCSKNTLIGLNILYILISFILIGVAVHGRTSNNIGSIPVVAGITACGVFLLFVSLIGLFGAVKHHQVTLFFYMVILFFIFIIQFSVSIASLSFSEEDEKDLVVKLWNNTDNDTRFDMEKAFCCCGLNGLPAVRCDEVAAYCKKPANSTLSDCMVTVQEKVSYAFHAAGTAGLLFSITEVVGAVIAFRFRNMMNPLGLGQAGAGFSQQH